MSNSLWPPWTAAHQASLYFTVSHSLFKLTPMNWWCHPTFSSFVVPFSCLQFFQHQSFLPVSQLFASGGPSIGASASASALPVNVQSWFLLRLTRLISLLSKGLSRVFSSTTIHKHQFFSTQPSLWSSSHICTCIMWSEVAQSCTTLCDPMDCSLPGSSWDFPGKSAGVGCHFLLQGNFPTQGSNPGLPHCGQMLYPLSHREWNIYRWSKVHTE